MRAEQAVADQLAAARARLPRRPPSGRRPRPARSSSAERIGLRSATISSSGIRVLAQWIAPAPMQNSASPRPRPSSLVDRPTCVEHVVAGGVGGLDREVGDDEQQRAQRGQAEEGGDLALAALGGLGVDVRAAVDVRRQARVRRTGSPARSVRAARRGCVVPSARRGVVGAGHVGCFRRSARRGCGRCPSSGPPARRVRCWSLIAPSPPATRRSRSGRRGRQPADQRPRSPARSCPSASPAGAGLGLGGLEEGDDVALVLGRHGAVAEDRHRLRAGQHRLVDVLRA